MKYGDPIEDVLDEIENSDPGTYDIFNPNVIDELFTDDNFASTFSERNDKFGIFLDPAESKDSTGFLLANRIGSGKESSYVIQAARRQPPSFLRELRKTISKGTDFLRYVTGYDVPVHVVLDTTMFTAEIEKLEKLLGEPRSNIRKHLIEKKKKAKHNHVVGGETAKAYGIRFGSAGDGDLKEWKDVTVSKELMVSCTIDMIHRGRISMDPDAQGAHSLMYQMEEFKGKLKERANGEKSLTFGSEDDDLVDALIMMGYWAYQLNL